MALTFDIERQLQKVQLVAFFDAHRDVWLAAARRSYEFVVHNFPAGAEIRQDDVAKILMPIIEADASLDAEIGRRKLTQKYWKSRFVDLIIARTWNEIHGGQHGNQQGNG